MVPAVAHSCTSKRQESKGQKEKRAMNGENSEESKQKRLQTRDIQKRPEFDGKNPMKRDQQKKTYSNRLTCAAPSLCACERDVEEKRESARREKIETEKEREKERERETERECVCVCVRV